MTPNDDCYFLLYFIMGTYFGPDLKGERVKRSVLQRKAEGLPPYTVEQLAGSHIKISEIEQIYYYLLRKANKSVVVKVPLLHQFIQGDFPTQEDDGPRPQFPALFPPNLHPKMEYFNQSIANVTYIRKPAVFYIKKDDIEKFKRLTGLENLFVETTVEKSIPSDKDLENKFPVKKNTEKYSGDVPIVTYYRGSQRKRRSTEILRDEKPTNCNGASKSSDLKPETRCAPGIVILTTEPSRQELDKIVDIARNAYALTGSAAKGIVGPVIGLMDLGESEDSYLFRVALPGVKRENRAFQCEVESDGRVLIKGETVTGEKIVNRYSQDFVMQSCNLCPPGPFSISFQLPGPVDPQKFLGTFGTNAILEGIVKKQKPSRAIIHDNTSTRAPTLTPAPTPTMPSLEATTVPSLETPTMPPLEVPMMPSWEALAMPSLETPTMPSWEAPAMPSLETPTMPPLEEPMMPSSEAPVVPPSEAMTMPFSVPPEDALL